MIAYITSGNVVIGQIDLYRIKPNDFFPTVEKILRTRDLRFCARVTSESLKFFIEYHDSDLRIGHLNVECELRNHGSSMKKYACAISRALSFNRSVEYFPGDVRLIMSESVTIPMQDIRISSGSSSAPKPPYSLEVE